MNQQTRKLKNKPRENTFSEKFVDRILKDTKNTENLCGKICKKFFFGVLGAERDCFWLHKRTLCLCSQQCDPPSAAATAMSAAARGLKSVSRAALSWKPVS
jgi:hypothetical protein